jgi:hypothetical protein
MTTTLPAASAPTHTEEMERLEILRAYKKQFAGDGTANRSPFPERVVRYDTNVEGWDIPEIHESVRSAIREVIRELHQGQSSRVAVFAGQVGIGKSHLLNHFRSPARQEELGYVFVSNRSNYWKIDEFEECLLTWVVAALTQPSIQGPNLLLGKVEDVAFQALEQVLDQPGKLGAYLRRRGGGWFTRLLARLGRDRHAQFRQACRDRDGRVFRRLDFPRFATFVCDQFLDEKTNPFHRFVLTLLLRYLFPEDRAKVCAWLIGQKVREGFLKHLGDVRAVREAGRPESPWPNDAEIQAHCLNEWGVADRLDRNYKLVETLKILISLFAPDLNRQLGQGARGQAGRVFFFAFDQAEGRKELFDREADWFKFFAKLSELYNALPNVFIVFTMTTDLRNQLYPRMERQFQQRIQRDQKFVLEGIEDQEILAVYQRRLELWRGNELPQVEPLLSNPAFRYLPFTQEQVLAKGRQKTLRQMLEAFDQDFRKYLDEQVVVGADARLEFLVALNELREQEKEAVNAFQYTEEHLSHVEALFKRAGKELAAAFGLSLIDVQACPTEEGFPALRLELRTLPADERWVRVFLARLPFQYKARADSYLGLLHHKATNKYFLWLVRPGPIAEEYEGKKAGQVFARKIEAHLESRLLALLRLLDKRERLPQEPGLSAEDREKFRKEAGHILVEEFKLAYLGEMFQRAAQALENQAEAKGHDGE